MSKFIKGTIILMAAGLITRVLGFINRIVIARFIGDEGVGLYMMAFPTLILVITITQLGLPVAISKAVAEAEAQKDIKKVKKILVVSLTTTIVLSLVFTPALIMIAPYLSKTLFTDPRTFYPLIAIAPVVPIIAISSVLRGYFQGRQNMKPAAISQVLEQVVRITLIAVLTKTFLPYGIEYAAAAAMFASVLGELASLIYLITTFKHKKRFKLRKNFLKSVQGGKDTFYDLMNIALPTTGSRLIGSVAWFLEPIVVSHSLAIAGVATIVATKQYGALTGYAMPLLMLPSFVNLSLATSLIPAISEAHAKKDFYTVEARLQQALRLTLVTGGLSVIILYILAKPLMILMYGTANGTEFITLMAPFFLFYYYQGPLQAALQALNLANAAMINSFIGSFVKIAVIFLLATKPEFGIMGAAIGILTGTILVTLLHFATILKKIPFTFYARDYVKTIILSLAVGYIGHFVYELLWKSGPLSIRIILTVFIMTFLYILFLLFVGLLKKDEVKRIPFLGKYLTRLILI